MADAPFILTKPGIEAGESLADIVAPKEAERVADTGDFVIYVRKVAESCDRATAGSGLTSMKELLT